MAGIASMVDLIFFVCSLSSLYYLAVCSHRDLILYTITVGKITVVQAPRYVYRRQNYKHNSKSIPKTFANLIGPKMWPLCMARNGGPSVDVRIYSWSGPTVDVGPSIARPTGDPQLARIADSPSHVEQDDSEPEEPESGPVSEGHGVTGNASSADGADLALEQEGDELDSDLEDGLGTEELDAEVNRLLQSIGLQNSDIEPNLPDGNPQTAVPETSNPGPPVPGRQPASAWYRGQYPLHQALSSCQQVDRSRREKDKERQIQGAA